MFHGWDNFFFMIGSAAGGLIGLLFVVVTLTAGFERSQALRGSALYMTPTAMHFAAVLSISAVAVAPGLSAGVTAALFGFIATSAGLAFAWCAPASASSRGPLAASRRIGRMCGCMAARRR